MLKPIPLSPALVLALSLAAALGTPAAPAAAAAGAIDPRLLAGLKARSIGPAAMSGRVTAVEGVASAPDTLYAGAAAGGVWKTVNGGLTWDPVFDDQPIASIGAIAVFQPNPDIVWVGTGEGNPRNSASIGNGVYRSGDGGHTWAHLGLDATERISRIVLDPTDPEVAYVAALGREWGENPERGVFKTTDGGRTWRKVLYVDERTGAADLAIDPANPRKLFAAMWQYRRWPWGFKSGGAGSGLYVSSDGGASWQRRTAEDGLPKGELGRIGLAIAPSAPEIVYALVEAKKSAILRSEDGGRTWKTVNDDPENAERPFYYAHLWVDPSRPNRVYDLMSRVKVSDDSGHTFERLGHSRDIHGDYHALWIDPAHPEHMMIGEDGGLGVSRDRGATWSFVGDLPIGQYYHVAVDQDVPYHVYGGLQDNGAWRGPNTAWERDGIRNGAWQDVGFGDGFECRPDPRDSTRGYSLWQGGRVIVWDVKTGERRPVHPIKAADGPELRFNWNAGFAIDPFDPDTIYVGSQFVHRSTDRGASWTTISPDLTTDNKAWQHQDQSGGLTLDVSAAENYTTIVSLAPSTVERGVLWVGTDDGRIQVTRDGGKTWTSVEGNLHGVPANTWIPQVKPSPFDAGTAFVVFDDHRRSNWTPYVFATTDYGRSWRSLATKDLRGYALAIEQDPVDRDLLFLGTEFGLWVSRDGGASWMPFRHGLPAAVSVMALAIQPRDGDLVIGTHGRALYVVDDIAALRGLTAAALSEPLHLFPIAPAQQHTVAPGPGPRGAGSGDFKGENRAYGALVTYALDLPGLKYPGKGPKGSHGDHGDRATAGERSARPRRSAASAGREAEAEPEGAAAKPNAEDLPPAPEAGAKPPEKEGTSDKGDKVTIEVRDAAGRLVRTFEGPAELGVNRAVWDLQRSPFREPPRERSDFERGVPEVSPGSYAVAVRFRGHEAKGTVKVLPDPAAAGQTAADWAAREAAVQRAGKLQDETAAAIDRVLAAKADVERVKAKLKQREEAAHPEEHAAKPRDPLYAAAEKLEADLSTVERRLWVPPHTQGLYREGDAMSKLGSLRQSLGAGWGVPDPTRQSELDQDEKFVAKALAEVDHLFSTEVAAFRQKAEKAGLGLLAEGGTGAVAK
jgi:photosystem II stability/assembly factor-like uncharacterized protein